MKKILWVAMIAVLTSCKAFKNIEFLRNIAPVQQVMLKGNSLQNELKTYSLKIPNSWYSFKEVHGIVMHSPKVMKRRRDNFYENNFYVLEYSKKVCTATNIESLFEYYHNKKKEFHPEIDFIPKKLQHKNYGTYYLIKYGTSWSKTMLFTNVDILFHYENRNFILSYISENMYYDEFIKDVEGVVKSFTIK